MNGLLPALWAESLKARKSKMFVITLMVFMFISIMMGLLMYVAQHPEIAGRSAMVGAKTSIIGNADWASFLNLLIQCILALGSLGFGMVTSWIFGGVKVHNYHNLVFVACNNSLCRRASYGFSGSYSRLVD